MPGWRTTGPVVAHPAHRVFANAIFGITDRDDLLVLPVLHALEWIEDPIIAQMPRHSTYGHVTAVQVRLDLIIQVRGRLAPEARDLDPLARQLQA